MALTARSAAPHPGDTIAAVSSAAGPGERAIVRVSGPGTRAVIDAVFTPADPSMLPLEHHLVPGSVRLTGIYSPLPASLYFFHGPRTYTGQDLAELHTIGSPPLVERLVADLLNAGARPAQPGEFTLRAFLAGKKDLAQAEAVQAVVAAASDDDLKPALAQLAGGMTRPLHAVRDDLMNLLADVEASLDFADEDIQFVGRAETLARLDSALSLLRRLLGQLDDRAIAGRPVRIAFVGLPNAGKSSLFNALATGDALVSPIPGTTRDYLTKRISLAGMAIELIDTAGWQAAEETIERQAQELGREQAGRADVVVWCAEGGAFTAADEARLAQTSARLLRAWTKCDLSPCTAANAVAVTVVHPEGTDELLARLADTVRELTRSPLAPSHSRCRHHIEASIDELARARELVGRPDALELVAAALRRGIDQLGEMTGAVYTNDLLDRIFSRFCIGK
jgi:tRNA modification GTPase